jgi:hypothetical protein
MFHILIYLSYQIRNKGITLQEASCLAQCNGLHVIVKRGDQITLPEFISDLQRTCSNQFDKETYMIVNFSRSALGQSGEGHFSPVTSFHAGTNKCLVLDTARFKYPHYFVDVEVLFNAMKPLDTESGLPRGYILLQRKNPDEMADETTLTPAKNVRSNPVHALPPNEPLEVRATSEVATMEPVEDAIPLCLLRNNDARDAGWVRLARVLCAHIPKALHAERQLYGNPLLDDAEALRLVSKRILSVLPTTFALIASHPGIDQTLTDHENNQLRWKHRHRVLELIQQVQAHAMFPLISQMLQQALHSSPSGVITTLPHFTNISSPLTHLGMPWKGIASPKCELGPEIQLQRWAKISCYPPPGSSLTSTTLHSPVLAGDVAATLLMLAFPMECIRHVLPVCVLNAMLRIRGDMNQFPRPLRSEVRRLNDQLSSLSLEFCQCRIRREQGLIGKITPPYAAWDGLCRLHDDQ